MAPLTGAAIGAILAAFAWQLFQRQGLLPPRPHAIPDHMLGRRVFYHRDLLSEETAAGLLALTKEMGEFPTNVQDLKFYRTANEHVGEAVPLPTDGGGCPHPYMVPSVNRTHCILPGRIDVGRHWVLTGGPNALRKNYASMVSRVQSFGSYHFSFDGYPVVERLFRDPKFLEAAAEVCPPEKPHLDPFQFNFNIQVPGQTVATHLDGPYFWGATRFQFPQWLLAAMVFSGFWEDRFVDQTQVVAYFHRWDPETLTEAGVDAGEFVYWDSPAGEGAETMRPRSVLPYPRAGSSSDGSKTVHAANVYRGDVEPPFLDKNRVNVLRYEGDDIWSLSSRGEGGGEGGAVTNHSYTTDDLRMSVVYRARCFENAEAAERFGGRGGPEEGLMKLDDVLSRFVEDLRARGQDVDMAPERRLDLALAILDTYVRYPLPVDPVIPFNYCAADRLLPALAPLLRIFC